MRPIVAAFVTLSAASGLLLQSASQAAERLYLKKSESFCDSNQIICIHGSLWYEPNSRVIGLNARIEAQTRPGTIRITFVGFNRQDLLRRTELSVSVRGAHSEIIDHQIRPDAPDVSEWQISTITFLPKQE